MTMNNAFPVLLLKFSVSPRPDVRHLAGNLRHLFALRGPRPNLKALGLEEGGDSLDVLERLHLERHVVDQRPVRLVHPLQHLELAPFDVDLGDRGANGERGTTKTKGGEGRKKAEEGGRRRRNRTCHRKMGGAEGGVRIYREAMLRHDTRPPLRPSSMSNHILESRDHQIGRPCAPPRARIYKSLYPPPRRPKRMCTAIPALRHRP